MVLQQGLTLRLPEPPWDFDARIMSHLMVDLLYGVSAMRAGPVAALHEP
jgi:hypothetical protein